MKHKILYTYAGIATHLLVTDPKFLILMDTGDGIIRDLLEEEITFPVSTPVHIFFTHGHYDHCGGLFSFLGFLRMIGQEFPVNLYYPEGAMEIEGLINLFKSVYQDTMIFEFNITKLKPGSELEIDGGVRIKAYQMKHGGSTFSHGLLPEIPALGYAILKNGKKMIAYTGDTGMNENLHELVKDACHAYIEATYPNTKQSMFHLSSKEASELGKLAKKFTKIHPIIKIRKTKGK